MVTAELATIIPFAVVFALLLLWIVSQGLTQVRVTDAAREGARLVARGETTATATKAAERLAPKDSKVAIDVDGPVVTVTVTNRSDIALPGMADIAARDLTAESTAVLEAP